MLIKSILKIFLKNINTKKYKKILNNIQIKINCCSCHGKGYVINFNQIEVCKYCSGTGLKLYN